ncbi:MAG: TerB family tellurite resistance protein [Proteobacteria bacterium]|nr:TerB family tellurite resistance protein [Pseudomonadota bacterium]
MINNIKTYFEDLFQNKEEQTQQKHTVELASTALMIEISLADDHIHEEERHVINNLLKDRFNLNESELDELVELAEKEVDHAVSLYEFTRLLNETLSMPDKIGIIENLWHVAYADSNLDKYEEYYIRKVADLLYISHADFIQSKLKAAE